MIDHTRLRKLAEAAADTAPEPWTAVGTGVSGGDHWYVCSDGEAIAWVAANDGIDEHLRQPRAEFMSAVSPGVVLALLDETEHLRAALRDIAKHGSRFDLTPTMCEGGSYTECAIPASPRRRVPGGRAPSTHPTHDHWARCCSEHGTHSMPHVGCVLR